MIRQITDTVLSMVDRRTRVESEVSGTSMRIVTLAAMLVLGGAVAGVVSAEVSVGAGKKIRTEVRSDDVGVR